MASLILTSQRMAELVRARLPFNPLVDAEITGNNLTRLQSGMATFGWQDARFVTRDDAQRLGWTVAEDAPSVQMSSRDTANGSVAVTELFNAENVRGIPSLADMLAMDDEKLAELQGRGDEEALSIGPAARVREQKSQVQQQESAPTLLDAQKTEELSGRYVVSAPYWLDGLHNSAGLAMARELNELSLQSGLNRDAVALQRLLEGRERSFMYELSVIREEEQAKDLDWVRNPAEPESLLDGALVRDKEGAYRPKVGGPALLQDLGESLSIKSKTGEAYQAAIELAAAKGWTAIELSGKGKMLSDAWLEARVAGLEVVNYQPSVEDEKRLAERMAQLSAQRAAQRETVVEQTPEIVEIHPYIDKDGHQKTATVTYTVTQEGEADMDFVDPKSAAKAFTDAPINRQPAIVRTVVRADGQVEPDVVAHTLPGRAAGQLAKRAGPVVDQEVGEALSEMLAVDKARDEVGSPQHGQMFSGLILRIEGNQVIQKIGRDPEHIVRHDITKLNKMPTVGEVEDITFDKSGRGIVAERGHSLER